jgi:hypothetical protein
MKQLGNLAMVCANRDDVSFTMLKGEVTVHVGDGPERAALTTAWHDDNKIDEIIRELNFGKYKPAHGWRG